MGWLSDGCKESYRLAVSRSAALARRGWPPRKRGTPAGSQALALSALNSGRVIRVLFPVPFPFPFPSIPVHSRLTYPVLPSRKLLAFASLGLVPAVLAAFWPPLFAAALLWLIACCALMAGNY